MTEFQKIAIGILGLTHPEMFIRRPGAGQNPTAKIARRGEGPIARTIRGFRFILAALAIGSRTLGLADNSELRRDLRARARLLYGSGEG